MSTGVIEVSEEMDKTDVENEVYRRVHNYVSSLYSYNEQIRDILTSRLEEDIDKGYFLPARENKGAPEYVRRGVFLWGLRNDFQHGDYWCLDVEKENERGDEALYHLYFRKQDFEATPRGNLDEAGDYLCHAEERELEYPLPYISRFHRKLFNDFETDFEEWCSQN